MQHVVMTCALMILQGPLAVLDRIQPADVAVSARHEDGEEHVNPATSVHATVVMDGTLSEGETDLSSMRQGIEGNIGSLVCSLPLSKLISFSSLSLCICACMAVC